MSMKKPSIHSLGFVLLVIFSCSRAASDHSCPWTDDSIDEQQQVFLGCLAYQEFEHTSVANVVYTPANSSYMSILQLTIQNLRFSSESLPKPMVIITPKHSSQIPPIIYCAKGSGMQIRTRSGGHDNEGLSYISNEPFVMIDLINLSEVTVDVEAKTAWVEAGTNIGTLYYRIAERNPKLGFPAGVCPTVGVGGHFSGGGFGTMHRKYGLAADNIIDAKMIDVNGRILDRKSMGEDLFWAIRGGVASSFGIILAWKVQLVDVPETVTVFAVQRTLEQNATRLVHRWQHVSPTINRDLHMSVGIRRISTNSNQNGRNMTIVAMFSGLFLGRPELLLPILQEKFPELGLVREDFREMRWIESTFEFAWYPPEARNSLPLEVLLNRSQPNNMRHFKSKSDFVQKPIPLNGLEGIWEYLYEPEANDTVIFLTAFGGRMEEVPESALPFPHRAGSLYAVQYWVFRKEEAAKDYDKYVEWVRRLYNYMTPYVSQSPRSAYIGSRDLDLGINSNEGETSYEQASTWGLKYFKNNFNRLVQVKTMVDPGNYFRNEQSIPPLKLEDRESRLGIQMKRDCI